MTQGTLTESLYGRAMISLWSLCRCIVNSNYLCSRMACLAISQTMSQPKWHEIGITCKPDKLPFQKTVVFYGNPVTIKDHFNVLTASSRFYLPTKYLIYSIQSLLPPVGFEPMTTESKIQSHSIIQRNVLSA